MFKQHGFGIDGGFFFNSEKGKMKGVGPDLHWQVIKKNIDTIVINY